MSNETPRIYVACLASYNNGVLYGEWIDATDEDDMATAIALMLRHSPHPNVMLDCPECIDKQPCTECHDKGKVPSAEEWAIHDYDGFRSLKLGEHPSLEKVAEHAKMIEEHGDSWIAYVGHVGEHYATEDGFIDAYHGQYSSAEDYAQELMEQGGDLKLMANLANYIDWERYARDMGVEGWAFVDDGSGGVYVFSP